MDESPTTEPKSTLFDILSEAEQRHNSASKKMRSLEDCLAAAVLINNTIQMGVDEEHITESDFDYESIRNAIIGLDHQAGEKTCRSADRHLIATYVCLMRGMPVPART
jgi:hypothetical protein